MEITDLNGCEHRQLCASTCAHPGCVIKGNISSGGERIYHLLSAH